MTPTLKHDRIDTIYPLIWRWAPPLKSSAAEQSMALFCYGIVVCGSVFRRLLAGTNRRWLRSREILFLLPRALPPIRGEGQSLKAKWLI